jgi:hypothetical protein
VFPHPAQPTQCEGVGLGISAGMLLSAAAALLLVILQKAEPMKRLLLAAVAAVALAGCATDNTGAQLYGPGGPCIANFPWCHTAEWWDQHPGTPRTDSFAYSYSSVWYRR